MTTPSLPRESSPRDAAPRLRRADLADVPALEALIAASAIGLGVPDYTPRQIAAALEGVFGVDRQLIEDGTYFVAERHGQLIGCGGWSRRATLFGSDAFARRDPRTLDPGTEPARIRAFFVHPDHARAGVGRRLLRRCEEEARRAGFTRMELMATLPGVPFYAAHGYGAGEAIEHPLPGAEPMRLVPMRKTLA